MTPYFGRPPHSFFVASLLERASVDAVEQVDDLDEARAHILDAPYGQCCRMGIQRSTMEEVARRAGVSRITIYRRFATMDALVEQVVRRESRCYFDRFVTDIRQAGTAADRVVFGFVNSLRAIRGNPLIGGPMVTEPDTVVPSMVNDGGRTVAVVRRFVAGRIRREQQAVTVPADLDVDFVAGTMVRISASFPSIPSHLFDLDDEQLPAAIARHSLVPMLEPRSPAPHRPPAAWKA